MQKLSRRQLLKHRTLTLMVELLKELVPEEHRESINKQTAMQQLGKRTYYKDHDTGVIKLGLCYKQLRKEVKANPYITVAEIKQKHKLG